MTIWGRPARLRAPEESERPLPQTTAGEGFGRSSASHRPPGPGPALDPGTVAAAPRVTGAGFGAMPSQLGSRGWVSRLVWSQAKSYCQCIATQSDPRSAVTKSALDVFVGFFFFKVL